MFFKKSIQIVSLTKFVQTESLSCDEVTQVYPRRVKETIVDLLKYLSCSFPIIQSVTLLLFSRRGILSVPSSSGPMSLPLPGYSGPPVVSGHKPPMGGTKALAHVPPPHWLQTPSRELTGKQGTDRRAVAKWSQHQVRH